ncbi:unnamed protein product [Caenorhabditis brenneri]
MNDSHITLYTKPNTTHDVVLNWGLTEARSPRNEVDIELNGKVIRIQKVRGEVDLKCNNLCLTIDNGTYQIEAFLSYLVFIFPQLKFRELVIDPYTFSGKLHYPTSLQAVTKTESLSIRPSYRNCSHRVASLLENLEVTKSLHIEDTGFYSWTRIRGSCTEGIFLRDATFLKGPWLSATNCSKIILVKSRFGTEDFLEFLQKWKGSDDALKRVNYVNIGHAWGVEKLYEQVGATKWDPAKRPRDFKLTDELRIDCSFGMDITKPNGRIGTIMQLTDDFFKFVVWPN